MREGNIGLTWRPEVGFFHSWARAHVAFRTSWWLVKAVFCREAVLSVIAHIWGKVHWPVKVTRPP